MATLIWNIKTEGTIIAVMTDGGTAYLNLGEEYDVNHHVVYHN